MKTVESIELAGVTGGISAIDLPLPPSMKAAYIAGRVSVAALFSSGMAVGYHYTNRVINKWF